MALIDSLLRMLVQHDGDTVRLTLGEAPQCSAGERPLRLFFPTFTTALRAQLLGDLVTPSRLEALAGGEEVAFVYEGEELPAFDVILSGADVQAASFVRKGTEAEREAKAAAAEAEIARVMAAALPPPPPVATTSAPLPEPVPVADTSRAPAAPDTPSTLSPVLRTLLETARDLRASDLHVAVGERPAVRRNGRLQRLEHPTVRAECLLVPNDTSAQDLAFDLDERFRVRAHLYRTTRGAAGAFRLLRRTPPALEDLGLPMSLHDLVAAPHGLVLVTGPTGSGKSTTLAALAQHALDTRGGVLVTLEDPIEYGYREGDRALVRQRELGRDVPDVATGLREALREDPDVLLIGELRDTDSIALALTAAETGHLVLASLHSRSAASAVDRIIDGLPADQQAQARTQLAASLRAVVAQRLLPDTRGGRIVALEVMRSSTQVAALVRDGRTAQLVSAIQSGGDLGMMPLERCLRNLVSAGRISVDTAREAANDPEALRLLS